nr:MAG TPA: DNA-directed RNA polymerase [Caudoviricetes sp.]
MESEGAGMKEYIEREALLELYQIDGPLNETGRVPLPVIRQNIMDMPAAEVAEVRHGRLEYAPYNGVYDAKCSNCGYSPGIKFWDSPYCPNCGALMLEDEHEAD